MLYRRQIARLFVVLAIAGMAAFSAPGPAMAGSMADPEPSIDNPRKILISVNTSDEKKVSSLLYNVINIQKAYGQDNVELALLAWGPGVRVLLKDSPLKDRIASQMMYDIAFIACGNTLNTIGISPDKLIDGVEVVEAGLPEIVEREKSGWSIIWP